MTNPVLMILNVNNVNKSYKSGIDLASHQKMHGNFDFDNCECKFDSVGQQEKYNNAVHGKVEIFCHYYNNDKDKNHLSVDLGNS